MGLHSHAPDNQQNLLPPPNSAHTGVIHPSQITSQKNKQGCGVGGKGVRGGGCLSRFRQCDENGCCGQLCVVESSKHSLEWMHKQCNGTDP